MSFRREKYVPRGGPNGGDGGGGGSVRIQVDSSVSNLAHLRNRKFWRAQKGTPGQGSNKTGARGKDLIILAPAGTIIRDRERGNQIRDLKQAGDAVVVARGGKGGKGNRQFASATNQTPREWEPGQEGESRWVVLELKVIADVGLIGLPNAGKSTLLSRVSRAQPEIAGYPFTTKYPNLGIVQVDWNRSLVVADIPGLIEGAHHGAGLGHEFLRHVERTRVLVHMVEWQDQGAEALATTYHAIRKELELFNPELAAKPELVVLSKMDLVPDPQVPDEFSRQIGRPVAAISAVTGRGVSDLVQLMGQFVDESTELTSDSVVSPPR